MADGIAAFAVDSQRTSIPLSDIADFSWDRVEFFGEYTSEKHIREHAGSAFADSWGRKLGVPEAHTLLVFIGDDGSACYVEVGNGGKHGFHWEFGVSVLRIGGYARDEAILRARRSTPPTIVDIQ